MRVLLLLAVGIATLTVPASASRQLAAPSNVVPPTITGPAKLGGTLTVSPGEWAGTAPITFTYQWMRCQPDCGKIVGATASTYTLTQADAVTTTEGVKTVISVYVIATNPYGGVVRLVNPGTAVDAPLPRPRTVGLALVEAMVVPDTAGTIPQILANNGYTAWYFARRTGHVDVTWTRTSAEGEPALAVGHRTFRQSGKSGTFKVRLTKRGKRLLARTKHVILYANAHIAPLNRPGGSGVGVGLELSADAPAKIVSI